MSRHLALWIAVDLSCFVACFWVAAALTVVGFPLNPYLTWFISWASLHLLIVAKLKRDEIRDKGTKEEAG